MAAVLLEEWLHELAALAQEHSVLQQEERVVGEQGLPQATRDEGPSDIVKSNK